MRENKGLITLCAVVIFLFTFLYPPFITTSLLDSLKIFRLIFEGLILLGLSLYSLKYGVKKHLLVAIVLCIYAINYAINTDGLDKVFSHFGKYALLIFLSSVMLMNKSLTEVIRKIWVGIWYFFSIMSFVGFVLIFFKIATPWTLKEFTETYNYHFLPIIGNYIFKITHGYIIPRYTGYFVEPNMIGFFFGFNMLTAKHLLRDEKESKIFCTLNLIGGGLTFSFSFFIFLCLWSLFHVKKISQFFSNKILLAITVIFIVLLMSWEPFVTYLVNILKFSSIEDRLFRFLKSISFINLSSFRNLNFGSGIVFFQDTISSGATSGCLGLLASRGIVILIIWYFTIYLFSRNTRGLFIYIFIYTWALDYLHFPFFILGVSLIGAISMNEKDTTNISY